MQLEKIMHVFEANQLGDQWTLFLNAFMRLHNY